MAPLDTSPFLASHQLTHALQSFPHSLPPTSSLLSIEAVRTWALDSGVDPLHPALLFCTVLSGIVFVLGELTGNVSWVDRLWTFLPVIYSTWFTYWPRLTGAAGGQLSERMVLVLVLQLLWSARLTTNTIRRGFFNPKEEDYRWAVVRGQIPTWAFKLLNLVFVAAIQNVLLLAVELPQYLLLTLHTSSAAHAPALGPVDYSLAALFIATLAVEMSADNQQQRYQSLKRRAIEKGAGSRSEREQAAVQRGFVTGGLWSWSRHPNFACEQFTWWVLYAFTVLPFLPAPLSTTLYAHAQHVPAVFLSLSKIFDWRLTTLWSVSRNDVVRVAIEVRQWLQRHEGLYWNYSIWGPISMSLLFYASTDLTERISASKYPLYKQYQRRVGMFWPPITTLKTIWLTLTRRRVQVDRVVFGVGRDVDEPGKIKML